MRVIGHEGRDERGAVLVIFAVYLLVAIIFLAFVVDIGNQRQDRRQLTTATDAAALAVAQQWADNSLDPLLGWSGSSPYDCSTEANEYLLRNREESVDSYTCSAEFVNGQLATVTVGADDTTEYQLGPVFGVDSGGIGSLTTVRISSEPGGGLRPFAICAYDEDVEAWYSAPTFPATLTVGGVKFLPKACEQQNSNWGFVLFETQGTGVPNLVEIFEEGTEDAVSSFDDGGDFSAERQVCIDDDADNTHYDDQDPVTCVFNYTGAGGWNNAQTAAAFTKLIADGTTFSLPLYGEVADLGGGEAGFPIIAFVEVRLKGFTSFGANGNSVTLEMLSLTSGDCCEVNESNQLLQICDVGGLSGGSTSFATDCETFTGTTGPPPPLPPLPDPCTVTSVLPPTRLAAITGSGSNYTLDNDETYVVTVDDPTDCVGPTVEGVAPGSTITGTVTAGPGADEFTVTFAAGTATKKNKIHVVEISDDGDLIDDSATLITPPG